MTTAPSQLRSCFSIRGCQSCPPTKTFASRNTSSESASAASTRSLNPNLAGASRSFHLSVDQARGLRRRLGIQSEWTPWPSALCNTACRRARRPGHGQRPGCRRHRQLLVPGRCHRDPMIVFTCRPRLACLDEGIAAPSAWRLRGRPSVSPRRTRGRRVARTAHQTLRGLIDRVVIPPIDALV